MDTLRSLRLSNHLTQKSLADISGDTRHAILRMEQHVYPTPLPSVLRALSEISGYPTGILEQQYLKEVSENRRIHGELWNLKGITQDIFDHDYGNLHEFKGFRMEMAYLSSNPDSAIQFCIAFSIHPYTLSEYENFKTAYPSQISIALTEAGLPATITDRITNDERFNRIE